MNGPIDDRWGLPQRKGTDFCRICTRLMPMTFEHVPPRAAGNRVPVRVHSIDGWLNHNDIRTPPPGGRQVQKGSGGYVLCADCNNTTGRRWAREYSGWARSLLDASSQHGIWTSAAVPGFTPMITFSLEGVFPGRFARQALTMLLVVSGSQSTSARNPILRKILLEGIRSLPGNIRLFMSLYMGPTIRMLPVMASFDLKSSRRQVGIECSYPPFSFVALLDGTPSHDLVFEMSGWMEIDPNARAQVDMTLPLRQGHTPFLADYRAAEDVGKG